MATKDFDVEFTGEQAELTNRVFPGWYGDAKEGQGYLEEWSIPAKRNGLRVQVIYRFFQVKGSEIAAEDLEWSKAPDDVWPVD